MNIPQTYEEFLKTPKDELIKISKSGLSLDDAKLILSFVKKLDQESDNILSEDKNKNANTFWEDLNK